MSLDTLLVVLSNLALVIATGLLISVSVREAHKHAEKTEDLMAANDARMISIIDATIRREQEHAHEQAKPEEGAF